MPMESQVHFSNISGDLQQHSTATFSWTTDIDSVEGVNNVIFNWIGIFGLSETWIKLDDIIFL